MIPSSPRIVVLTSCTAVKAPSATAGLTQEDFARGPSHVKRLHRRFAHELTPAEELYRGQQHARLMTGVRRARSRGLTVELLIVSAGYGLVQGTDRLAPYECSFHGMGREARREWTRQIGIPAALRTALSGRYDLGLVLLGEDYLDACELESGGELGGPTVVFCGNAAALRLPTTPRLVPIRLGREEARLFSCGLVALKGEVVGRLLTDLAERPKGLADFRSPGLLKRLALLPQVNAGEDAQVALAV